MERETSDFLFDIGTQESFILTQKKNSEAKRKRSHLIRLLRNKIEKDGKSLFSESDQEAFSRHGSAYQRLTLKKINDIDIYVVLNGTGLNWENFPLAGTSKKQHPHLQSFLLSTQIAIDWMYKIVCKIITDQHKIEKTKRDMQFFLELGSNFPRDTKQKILGFRDIVKMLKFSGQKLDWEETNGITSFIIRFATAAVFRQEPRGPSHSNQKTLERVVEQLNSWIEQKSFKDPYSDEYHQLKGNNIDTETVTEIYISLSKDRPF
mmetsp:Transcript_29258/g.41186  ORF Transcript_29258/g.41186 Transcript_29258/m.41186 type:complete len:263 (+) Transcript_29258:84-872(+)